MTAKATLLRLARGPRSGSPRKDVAYPAALWLGIVLTAAAALALAALGRWGGAAVLTGFAGATLWFLHEMRLPALYGLLFVASALVNACGWAFGFFRTVWFYDDAAHVFTAFTVALTFGFLAYHSVRVTLSEKGWVYVVAITSFGLSAGALWEIAEWLFLGPLADTASDLVMDGIGALAAALVALAGLRDETATRHRR